MRPPILFITRKWRGVGGMQRYAQDLPRALREHHEVIVCAADMPLSFLWFPWKAVWYAFRLRSRKPVVHLGDCAILPIGVLLRTLFGMRFSAMSNGLDVFYPQPWYQWMLKRCLPCASVIVAPSERLRRDLLERGVRPETICVIPCGIWPDECVARETRSHPSPHLLTVGRLIPRKGVLWFLREAFPIILQRHPGARYSVIGVGPEARFIKRLIRKRGWSGIVRLRPQAEREQAFADADIFVMPNIDVPGNGEGLGIVCLEAPVRSVPVVAAKLPAIDEAVADGVTGTFYEAGNPMSCAEAVDRLLSKPLETRAMREHVLAHYAWPMLAGRYDAEVFPSLR